MSHAHDPKDVEDRLWKEVRKQRFGMLGLTESHQHYQPMTAFTEPDSQLIWFFTRNDTDLARAVASDSKAMFIVQSKDQDIQACIGGALMLDHDRSRIEKFWNPHIAAWFPEGKDDPTLTLLRLEPDNAAVWLSEAGPVRYALEIAKANLTHSTPDLGSRETVNFNSSSH